MDNKKTAAVAKRLAAKRRKIIKALSRKMMCSTINESHYWHDRVGKINFHADLSVFAKGEKMMHLSIVVQGDLCEDVLDAASAILDVDTDCISQATASAIIAYAGDLQTHHFDFDKPHPCQCELCVYIAKYQNDE